jgi:hypothetical protein
MRPRVKRHTATVDGFGHDDPRKMPVGGFFRGAIRLDYATAVRANDARQNFSVCPRQWYIDATFRCARCKKQFVFSAKEQRYWYEKLQFYVDSYPKHCKSCRQDVRRLKALQEEYDRDSAAALAKSADVKQKKRMVAVVNMLDRGGVELPEKAYDKQRILKQQLERLRRSGAA